jgi:H+/Cl- antiporter ClcA
MQIPVENMIKNDKEVNLLNNDKVHLLRANRIIESNLDKKNDDEVSLFSMFNDYYSKISDQILYHVIFGFVVIFTTLSLLYIYRIYSEEINNIASLVFSSIINFNYYWYLIPLICIFLFLYLFLKYGKKIKIKKIIKKLVKKFKGNSEKNNINEI